VRSLEAAQATRVASPTRHKAALVATNEGSSLAGQLPRSNDRLKEGGGEGKKKNKIKIQKY